jgi:poly(3-hydroxybutyrate) depolymerase
LADDYCIDENRVFSTGMSYGGIMSNTVGCEMGDVFRAIAPMSGLGPYGITQCTGQVAAWISHGTDDAVLPIRTGQASRDHWVEANSCLEQSSPVDPNPCVAYEGCDEDYPVIWCEFDGGHVFPSFAPDAIWEFFQQF